MEVDEELNQETAPIYKLNDDSLLRNLNYLPEEDVVSLTHVSKRFNCIANQWRFEKQPVVLNWFSWQFLQSFGLSIRCLHLHFNVYDEICPKLREFSCSKIHSEVFSNPVFCEALPQLKGLIIGVVLPSRSYMEYDKEDALRCCENGTKIFLGRSDAGQSNFKPFIQMAISEMQDFRILILNSSFYELVDFLRAKISVRSLTINADYRLSEGEEAFVK